MASHRNVENEFHDVNSCHSVFGDHLFNVSHALSRRTLLSWIDTAPDGVSLAVPASDKNSSPSSSRWQQNSKNLTSRSTKRLGKCTMQTRCYALKASSGDFPHVNLESDFE